MLEKLYRFIIHQESFPLFIAPGDKKYHINAFDGLFFPECLEEDHLSFLYTGIDKFPDEDWESFSSYITLGSNPSSTMASEDVQQKFLSLIDEQDFPFHNEERLFEFFRIKDFLKVFVQTLDAPNLEGWVKKIEEEKLNK